MYSVVYCMDSTYRQHFFASVMSLLLNFTEDTSKINVYVVIEQNDNDFYNKIRQLNLLFKSHIDIVALDKSVIDCAGKLPRTRMNQFSMAMYFRLFLPSILPRDLSKVLYLDCDTIVLDSIHKIFEEDMKDASIAGVLDFKNVENSARLNLKTYINSGVMLCNLDNWRDKNITGRCINWLSNNKEMARLGDQCAINFINQGYIHLLDETWNGYVLSDRITKACDDLPGIIHYITGNKPWHSWYANDIKKYYWRYLDVSPWKGATPSPPATTIQAHKLARLLSKQGKAAEASAVYENILSAITK